MSLDFLQIASYEGPGYAPVIDFEHWRVAQLNFEDGCQVDRIGYFERHNESDEVFVLQAGRGLLLVCEGAVCAPHNLKVVELAPGKLYNVPKGVWHACSISREGTFLIVENRNTGKDNSDYSDVTEELRAEMVRQAGGWRN